MLVGRGFSALDGKCVNFKEFCVAKNRIFGIEYTTNGCNKKVLHKFKTRRVK